MFFEKFNKITYDPTGQGMGKEAVNIINSLLLKYHPATNTTHYFFYTVKDLDTPEVVAHKYYGDVTLHWLIILMNRMVDPFFDWALDSNKFQAMLTSRYGSGNETGLHHFIDLSNGNKRIDEVATLDAIEYFDTNGHYPVNISPVSNADYELELNDARREIKILQKRYVNTFIHQLEQLMNNRASL